MRATLIDPGDKRRAASFGNAGHIGAEQVMPWSTWGNVLRAPVSSFAFGGPLDFRWSDAGLSAPWALRFLAACDPRTVARGHAALKLLLADAMAAWLRLAGDIGASRPGAPARPCNGLDYQGGGSARTPSRRTRRLGQRALARSWRG